MPELRKNGGTVVKPARPYKLRITRDCDGRTWVKSFKTADARAVELARMVRQDRDGWTRVYHVFEVGEEGRL